MATDEIMAELRAVRAELDRRYPAAARFCRQLKSREKAFKGRLAHLAPVPKHAKNAV